MESWAVQRCLQVTGESIQTTHPRMTASVKDPELPKQIPSMVLMQLPMHIEDLSPCRQSSCAGDAVEEVIHFILVLHPNLGIAGFTIHRMEDLCRLSGLLLASAPLAVRATTHRLLD